MTNAGMFVDRFPGIKPAGVPNVINPSEGVAECLKFPFSTEDVAEAISVMLPKVSVLSHNNAPPNDVLYQHYNTNVKRLLEADVKTGFEAFRAELRETAYKSYWRDEVGKIPDQVPNLPVGTDVENTTFGCTPKERITAAEIINPKKCQALVNFENQVGRRNYCISHNSYGPGEQRKRMTTPLPSDMVFGIRNKVSTAGSMKPLMQWADQSVVSMTSKSLADYKDTLYYPLGKGRVRSGVPECVNDHTIFGKPSNYGEIKVFKDSDKMLPLQVAYVFKVRQLIKKNNINLMFLKELFNEMDCNKTSMLPIEVFYKIFNENGLSFDKTLLEPILLRLNYLNTSNNTTCYKDVINLFDIKHSLPDFGTSTNAYTTYSTVYKDQCDDLDKKSQFNEMPIAGSSAFKENERFIRLPFGPTWSRANLEDIPMTTTIDDVIRPHIFTHYGLSIYDVFKPRTKEYIKELFVDKVGLKIPDDVFETMWKESMQRNGIVSVETFKNILREISMANCDRSEGPI